MLYATSYQALQLPLMLLTGMLMAAASLLFRGIRSLTCAGTWLSLICDILMGAVWGVIFCAGLWTADMGRMRLYHLLAAALGALLFHAAFCIPVCSFCRRAGSAVIKLCRVCAKNSFVRMLLR